MFKNVKQPDFIVSHRLKGVNAKRDPLLDEKLGSNKRSRMEDGSASVIYKETPDEKKARLQAERQAEKEAKDSRRKGPVLGPSKASLLGLPEADEEEGNPSEDKSSPRVPLSQKEATHKLADFRQRLRGSRLPDEAVAAETRHRQELEAETAKALAANEEKRLAKNAIDSDERLSMNDIWKAGEGADDDHSAADWLGGQGLKFHTTADKAFSMAEKRFKETDGPDVVANREAAASLAKKRSEMRMAEMLKQHKG
mmetsp:Transcript_4114/g.7536  ORF Transcript_4114/g.7536 Transcript_4114/m.7536 type:complete len:254 (+) Transcript_4114:58-819(+)